MTIFTDHITVIYGLSNQSADYIARTYDRYQFGAFLKEKEEKGEYETKIRTPGLTL